VNGRTRRVNLLDGEVDDHPPVDLATVRMRKVPPAAPVIGPVEMNVPIPKPMGRYLNPIATAAMRLQPGQSFHVTGSTLKTCYASAATARKRTGAKFATRVDGDGIRIWRTA
jgi:hypothetical protein